MLRKAAGSKEKVTWNEKLEEEYKNVMNIMQTRIRLIPYDQNKRLRIVIDGVKKVGTGFLSIQYLNDAKPEKGVNIIHTRKKVVAGKQPYLI